MTQTVFLDALPLVALLEEYDIPNATKTDLNSLTNMLIVVSVSGSYEHRHAMESTLEEALMGLNALMPPIHTVPMLLLETKLRTVLTRIIREIINVLNRYEIVLYRPRSVVPGWYLLEVNPLTEQTHE